MDLQWLVLLGFFGALFSCGAWFDRQSYAMDEDVYKPSRPWERMIWEAGTELSSLELPVIWLRRH